MRIRTSLAASTGVIAIAAMGLTATNAAAAPAASRVVGQAYVDNNTAGANTITGFDRHADGTLTLLPGSPFAAGGAGFGAGLGSQGAIQVSPDGKYLLAVDAGSNQISVLKLGKGGIPKLVGAPTASGGVKPVSLTISRAGIVYVANTGNGGSNYTGFRLRDDGQLTTIANSTFPVPEGSDAGDILFDPLGVRVVATRDTPSLIDSFHLDLQGRLVPAAGSPFVGQGLGQIGAQFNPAKLSRLYVSNAHNGALLGTVSGYDVGILGALKPIGASPFADFQTAPCWVEISHDGKYLFAVNTGSASISRYSIEPDGGLVLLGTTTLNNGTGAVDARLSPDGRTLLVTGGRGRVLSSLAVSGGTLTELPSSPVALPAGTAPTGLVVT